MALIKNFISKKNILKIWLQLIHIGHNFLMLKIFRLNQYACNTASRTKSLIYNLQNAFDLLLI